MSYKSSFKGNTVHALRSRTLAREQGLVFYLTRALREDRQPAHHPSPIGIVPSRKTRWLRELA